MSEQNASEPWHNLKVGDRVRIVRLPSGVDAPGYTFFPETRQLYLQLISRKRAVRVYKVDELGLPWIYCRFWLEESGWEHHYLAINDDSWVPVRSRE